MYKVLITGADSYIGNSFKNYIEENYKDNYLIDVLDMMNNTWKEYDFSKYDSVYHVAGIAHSDNGNISSEQEKLYYKVNTDLTIETATKAKQEGVKQFIFMSSIIIYGDSAPIGKQKIITKDTLPSPINAYGNSKLQAEIGLNKLSDDSFKVCILRCPMIYGKNSKGNFKTLTSLALKLPIFPKVDNSRSMLYVKNLTEFVRLMIENEEGGTFFPQNKEYSNTTELVKLIAKYNNKKIALVNGFTGLLKLMSHLTNLVNKAFGNLTYDQELSNYKQNYRLYSLEESIKDCYE